ncbi:MAG: hypothetical protein JMM77_00095 [Candidatus Xiphinematobacter sp.]|nr:MAG: hypothetical protein JMM77_00095 [Candidatus Xiphinematobacter sp.]
MTRNTRKGMCILRPVCLVTNFLKTATTHPHALSVDKLAKNKETEKQHMFLLSLLFSGRRGPQLSHLNTYF